MTRVALRGRYEALTLDDATGAAAQTQGMPRTFSDLWEDASELSEKDRADLAGLLIETLNFIPRLFARSKTSCPATAGSLRNRLFACRLSSPVNGRFQNQSREVAQRRAILRSLRGSPLRRLSVVKRWSEMVGRALGRFREADRLRER
jgi:hypothetical protein